MTPEQSAAYIISQVACAMSEMFSMQAANLERADRGEGVAYGEEAFMAVQEKYCIGHNAVLGMFQQTY